MTANTVFKYLTQVDRLDLMMLDAVITVIMLVKKTLNNYKKIFLNICGHILIYTYL